jgi:hypothetical protein
MRAKELKRCLSSPYPKSFSGLDESKKADKPTLDLSWVVFMAWIRPDSARPILELFNLDESKRAEKMLEITLSQVFSGLDESKKGGKPTLDLSWVIFMTWMRARYRSLKVPSLVLAN